MNKGRRHELKMLKYKKRIARFARALDVYIFRDGDQIRDPKAADVVKDNGQHCYRTTSTPCSCFMCRQPERKYNRAKLKRAVIIEYFEERIYKWQEAVPRRDIPYKFRNSIPFFIPPVTLIS